MTYKNTDQFDCSVAFISVTETEDYGVRSVFPDMQPLSIEGDRQEYFTGVLNRNGKEHRFVYANQKYMGMVAASVLAMKIISAFSPRFLIMVGISAGVAKDSIDQQIYGDVVVASEIWDYSSGKYVSAGNGDFSYGSVGFISRPSVIETDQAIIDIVKEAAKSPDCQNHVLVGPMACGTSVVANREVLMKQIHSKFSDTVGLDMESYGIAYAAENSVEPRSKALIIKSVCDYADSEKSDKYQKFAACTAAEFAVFLCENYLL